VLKDRASQRRGVGCSPILLSLAGLEKRGASVAKNWPNRADIIDGQRKNTNKSRGLPASKVLQTLSDIKVRRGGYHDL